MSSVPKSGETKTGVPESQLNRVTNPERLSASSRSTKGSTVLAGATVTALVTLCFFLLFWNRFLGLRSGDGGFTGGVFFLKGILPYRDYYCPTPPLFVFRSAAVLAIFGKLPIMLRGFAVFERLILSLLLYGWLARFFRVKDAALAAIVTTVVSAGDYADPVSSYNHFTIIMAIATGLAASYALDKGRTKRALAAIGCVAGFLALLCLATKQTIGLGVTVAIPLAVGLSLTRLEGFRKAFRFLAGFAAGWSIASLVWLAWMAHFGILRAFLTQAFVTGPAAKASHPGDFVVHTITTMRGFWWAALIALAVLVIAWGALRRSQNEEATDTNADSLKGILLVLLLGLGVIVASSLKPLPFRPDLAAKPTIYLALFGSGLLILYYLWRYLSGIISRRQSQFALIACIAFIVAFMTSLSFPAFEAMTIPGLALILAVLLNDFESWRRWLVYAACAALLCCGTQFKLRIPFGFDGWQEPSAKSATMTSSLPELRGFLLPANTIEFVDSTIRIIRENSSPADTIFVYPELGFFYGITERKPATFSCSHNFDVVPDSMAKEEAARLLRTRPAVLIYAPTSEQYLQANEAYWRNGKPSGQRDIIAAAETLTQEYRFVQVFRLYPFGDPVYVFVRPGAEGSGTPGVLHGDSK
jgi:hypothetical protein